FVICVKEKMLLTRSHVRDTVRDMDRSAAGPIVVVHEAELFAATKSVPAELVTVARLVRTPSAVGWTVRVRVAVPLLTIFPNVQVTTPFAWENVPGGVAETNEAPAGTGSVTAVLAAAEGPLLVTWSV